MIGDLRISFKVVPATANIHNSYVRMVASVNGTRFQMALKQIVFSGSQEKLASISSTLFRIYKEAQLKGQHITAQTLKKQFQSSPPTLLYKAICLSNNEHLLNLGKTISYEQYRFQLRVIQQIPVFCQLHYGLPDISVSALPDNFLSQFRDFLYRQQTIEKCDIEEQIRFIRATLLKEHQKGNIELSIPLKEQLTNFHIPNKRLIPEDICKLVETHLPQHLATIRDAFVFGCHTGLSYNAISQLTGLHLRIVSDQSLWLFTDKQQYPLSYLPEYLKHTLLMKKDKNVHLFRLPSIQYINISLRSIAIRSNVKTGFTFKSARAYYNILNQNT